jgi:hypothetical protein
MATSKKTKTCNTCEKSKSLDKFGKDSNAKDGKKGKCKPCTAEYIKGLRAGKKVGSSRNSNKSDQDSRAGKLIAGAKVRSKKKGISCTITAADIVPALILGFCEATGMPFEVDLVVKSNGDNFQHPFAPSIDRIDPEVGYDPSNVQVVVRGYNMLKGEGSIYQARQIAAALVNNTKKKIA